MDVTFSDVLSYAKFVVPLVAAVIYLISGIYIVDQWNRVPVKRFGKYVRTLGPGFSWMEPFSTSSIDTISIKDNVDDLHECLDYTSLPSVQTHDNVPVTFRTLLTYRIKEARVADFVLTVEDDYESLWKRALTIISEYVSNTELDSILHDRQALYTKVKAALQVAVEDWGVEIIAVELKDVTIADQSIQEAIAMKARAQKEAEAELTRAKMQREIAEQLKLASHTYDEAAWKLKGFETLLELCRSAENNTVMIPTDLVQGLAKVLGK